MEQASVVRNVKSVVAECVETAVAVVGEGSPALEVVVVVEAVVEVGMVQPLLVNGWLCVGGWHQCSFCSSSRWRPGGGEAVNVHRRETTCIRNCKPTFCS